MSPYNKVGSIGVILSCLIDCKNHFLQRQSYINFPENGHPGGGLYKDKVELAPAV